jgi:hypothetical protein
LALKGRSHFINLFVGIGYRLMNAVPEIRARDVFKIAVADATPKRRGKATRAGVPDRKVTP